MNHGITDLAILKSIGHEISIEIGSVGELVIPPRPRIDLILGIPRPRLLPNTLSTISCLGVSQLFLLRSAKVDKNYMSSISLPILFSMPSRFALLSAAEVDRKVSPRRSHAK